jgi:CRP/FNR family cyclic AMP-dependent transcriptional regulator
MPPTDPPFVPTITFSPGQTVFPEGGIGDVAYVVQTGEIEIARKVKGERKVLGIIQNGGMFGEMALIDGAPRMAEAVALKETHCLIIKREVFDNKLKNADPFIKGLLRIMVRNVRSMADG